MTGRTPSGLAAEVARLAGAAFGPEDRVALAVSGGADSLALLALAAEGLPGRVHVLSVDHGLRAEAAGECAAVAELCAGAGVPHHTLRVEVAPGGDVQARARAARYRAMGGWCHAQGVRWLLTAHHADDQAETLLMRLARGSGLGGLAGVRARVRLAGVEVLRPLLCWRRAELAALVAARGWAAAHDPSNSDPRFERTQARSLLAREPWLEAGRLAASAAHLAEAEAALDWAAERAFATRSAPEGAGLWLDAEGLPAELRRRLLVRGLAELGAEADGPALMRLLARLEAGGTATLAGVQARASDSGWLLRPAPPRKVPSPRT